MNFWKQTTHVMSYFKDENFRGDKRLPSSFMTGFLEVRPKCPRYIVCRFTDIQFLRVAIRARKKRAPLYIRFNTPCKRITVLNAITMSNHMYPLALLLVRRKAWFLSKDPKQDIVRSVLLSTELLLCAEFLSLGPELIGNNVTDVLQIYQSLLQCIHGKTILQSQQC